MTSRTARTNASSNVVVCAGAVSSRTEAAQVMAIGVHMPMLRMDKPTTMKPTKKNIMKVAVISKAAPKDDRQTAPNEVEPHRRAQETSRYRLKSVAQADNTIRIVKGRMPALAQDSGMDSTPPPTMVAVILNTAAMTLAFRVDDDTDGTRKATSAMEVACRRSGMNVGYRRRMGDSGTSWGLTTGML